MLSPPTPSGSFSGRTEPVRNHRAASPPLEKDEKEFTQTARGMQKRNLGGNPQLSGVPSEVEDHSAKTIDSDALFGEGRTLNVLNTAIFISSPAMKPSLTLATLKRSFEDSNDPCERFSGALDWDMRSPEIIELDELDAMLDEF
jgi:hypothetical protein